MANPLTAAIQIVQGDDYRSEDSRAFIFSCPVTSTVNLVDGSTTVSASFYSNRGAAATLTVTCTVQNPNTDLQQVTFELTAAQTALLVPGTWYVPIIATIDQPGTEPSHVITLVRVTATVKLPLG